MIVPNKAVAIEDSALGMIGVILKESAEDMDVSSLYKLVADDFDDINKFMLALDILYVLRRVDVNFETGVVSYVG